MEKVSNNRLANFQKLEAPVFFSSADENVPEVGKILGRELNPSGKYSLRQRQKKLRSKIFRGVRVLIAEKGYFSFSMKELADECETTRQTIYNLVGDRENLIKAAQSEHLKALILIASKQNNYPNLFLEFANVAWRNSVINSVYVKEVMLTHHLNKAISVRDLHEISFKPLYLELLAMEKAGKLRKGVDVKLVAEHVHYLIISITLRWVRGEINDSELRCQLLSGTGFFLLGVMRPSHQEKVERFINNFFNDYG